jgi:hypothetical protein
MQRLIGGTFVVWVILASNTGILNAQTRITDKRTCTTCAIELTHVARIGTMDGPGALSDLSSVMGQTKSGDYLVLDIRTPAQLLVFDSSGQFKRRVGRKGQGPGEFNFIDGVVPHDDGTISLFDGRNNRRTRLSASYTVLEETPLLFAGISQYLPVSATQMILVGRNRRDPSAYGFPVHILEGDKITRSFGVTGKPDHRMSARNFTLLRRSAALGSNGVWLITPSSYLIERWSLTGTLLASFRRDASWFKTNERSRVPNLTYPPNPIVGSAWESPDKLLWVASVVADPNWKSTLKQQAGPQGIPILQPTSDYHYRDAIIEVLDPGSAQLVTSIKLPGRVRFLNTPGFIQMHNEDEEGNPFITIHRVKLKR